MRLCLVFGLLFLMSPSAWTREPVQENTPQTESADKTAAEEEVKITESKPMSFWMKHKLDYSKTMLESLTMGDFERLAKTAKQMRRLGKFEGFVRSANPSYQAQLKTFDLSTQELIRYAEQDNPDGATLAFNQLTTSCVACHTLLREGID